MLKNNSKLNEPKRLGFLFFIIFMICVVTIGIFAQLWKRSLIIERVLIEGARSLTSQELVKLSGINPQDPLFGVNVAEIQRRLKSQPMIKDVFVERHFPNILRLKIVERIPIAYLRESVLVPIDEDGILLPQMNKANLNKFEIDLPLISGIIHNGVYKPGHQVNNNEVFLAIKILRIAQTIGLYQLLSEINMNQGNDIYLYAIDAGVPIILGRNDFEKKMKTLNTFWHRFVGKENAPRLRYIDLRFDEQVVVKWNVDTGEEIKKYSQNQM